MFKKGFLSLTILIFLAISFSVYIHEENIDDLAYIIAVGIDKDEDEELSITFQMSLPSDSKSSNESSSSGGNSNESSSKNEKKSNDTITKTVKCKSINSGLNMVNNMTSKRVDLSHCKLIVFSEEIAKDGVSDFIYTLENNLELRSNCSILVSNSEAKEFLETASPTFENSTVSYYETIRKSSKYTGYTYNVTLNNFYTSISDSFGEPCAMLSSIIEKNDNSSEDESQSQDIKFDGLAVFRGDKFVGELTPEETLCFLIVTDNLKRGVISIPSPFDNDKIVDIHISKFNKTKTNVDISNSIPYVNTNIFLDCTIMSNSSDFDSNSSYELNKLEFAISEYIKSSVLQFYNKISKEYKTDICGFGKHAVHYFLTENDWNDYNWNSKISDANFDVNINVNINTSYFIS